MTRPRELLPAHYSLIPSGSGLCMCQVSAAPQTCNLGRMLCILESPWYSFPCILCMFYSVQEMKSGGTGGETRREEAWHARRQIHVYESALPINFQHMDFHYTCTRPDAENRVQFGNSQNKEEYICRNIKRKLITFLKSKFVFRSILVWHHAPTRRQKEKNLHQYMDSLKPLHATSPLKENRGRRFRINGKLGKCHPPNDLMFPQRNRRPIPATQSEVVKNNQTWGPTLQVCERQTTNGFKTQQRHSIKPY